MCELQIFLRDKDYTDEAKRLRGYKRGMVHVVRPDGHTWGDYESKQLWIAQGGDPSAWPGQGFWAIIKIPNVSHLGAAADFQKEERDQVLGEERLVRRRSVLLDFSTLTALQLTRLATNGEISLTDRISDLQARMKSAATIAAAAAKK